MDRQERETKPGKDDEFSRETNSLANLSTTEDQQSSNTPKSLLFEPFNIFLRNFRLFFSIFALTTFPLSLLLFLLSLSSHPIATQIHNLEAVAVAAPSRFEADHIWKDCREESHSLLRLKALYFLPSYSLSLLAAVATVSSTASAFSGHRPTVSTVVTAVRQTWKRPLATSLFIYGVTLAFVLVRLMLSAVGAAGVVVGAAAEVFLAAVLSMGLVVSIAEDRVGWEAIRIGWDLMEGRRVIWWALSGLFVVVSGIISWEVNDYMDGQDSLEGGWTVVMKWLWDHVCLVCLFGLLVLWSYIVTTVFYCECRRRHSGREESDDLV